MEGKGAAGSYRAVTGTAAERMQPPSRGSGRSAAAGLEGSRDAGFETRFHPPTSSPSRIARVPARPRRLTNHNGCARGVTGRAARPRPSRAGSRESVTQPIRARAAAPVSFLCSWLLPAFGVCSALAGGPDPTPAPRGPRRPPTVSEALGLPQGGLCCWNSMYLWDLSPVAVSLPRHGRASPCYWQSCHHLIGIRF